MNKKGSKTIFILIGIAVVVFAVVFLGISLTKNIGKTNEVISIENATAQLNDFYKNITVTDVPARKDPNFIFSTSVKDSLPSISKYPPQVENTTPDYVEIFSSTEKAGSNKDGWLNEMANEFNSSNYTLPNGKQMSVRIRGIASGLGTDYITSGKYLPDAFSPSNVLWGEMIKAKGGKIALIEKRIAGNVAGILLSKAKQDLLVKKYGSINLKTITEAVAANEIAMGYTNPFASSTGLNFLVSTLLTFDAKDPLSSKAVAGFEKFQANIPFVSYTTLQMRESAQSGVLDGFILEYQSLVNIPELLNSYVFTPFGVRHDSPVYAIGELSADKTAILKKFIDFCKQEKGQKIATDYGFNGHNEYKPEAADISGDKIVQAQKLWKEKKDVNKEISAVFVADVSGSMNGEKLNKLKESLVNGAQYIGKDNEVGLVSFSSDVNINLPIAKFDINQRSLFSGAVKDLQASGSTAMYDAIVVATKLLIEQKAKYPNAQLMLFVLTDGETNGGLMLNDVQSMLQAFKIPIYTIGYDANVDALKTLSSINEAASINADAENVVYQLGSLFNAQM
ncbi:MAG: VWA domain-containing protein [Clostridia bacterium]